MRGLIIKDMLFLKSTWKNLLVMLAGSILLSIALGNYLLAIVTLPIMLMSSGITTFQTDEFYNTESYTLSFPLSRGKIVTSKYLFTLIMMIISTFVGLLIYSLIHFIINPGYNGLNTFMIQELLIMEFASLLVDSVFYPVIYKYGCEKSRFVLMSIVMGLLGIGSILSVYVNVFKATTINFEAIIKFIETNGVLVMSIIAVAATSISYGLSILFYRHKDF